MSRLSDLKEFYRLLGDLAERTGGTRRLSACHGRMDWPKRGVYFFFELGESRSDSGDGPRVVRVGTHALKAGSATTLWNRLAQHRGVAGSRSGNHRGSIFRLLVGDAIRERDSMRDIPSWGVGSDPGGAAQKLNLDRDQIQESERDLEKAVSAHIGVMPFLWLDLDDPPGPESRRGLVERNSIALLSNFDREPIDPPSSRWLGHHSDRPRVKSSGLWNNNHVDEQYDRGFLDILWKYIDRM